MEATRASKSFGMTFELFLTEIGKPPTTLIDVVLVRPTIYLFANWGTS